MADAQNIDVYLTMKQNTVSPGMQAASKQITDMKSVVGDLTTGTTYLGTALLGMGIALERSNNSLARNAGNMLTMVGGILSSVAALAHMTQALTYVTAALQRLNVAQAIANALSGPAGWAKLAVGAAVAGGAVYGISKLAGGGGGDNQAAAPVQVNVYGSVVTQRQLVDEIHEGLLQRQNRTVTSGLR